MITINDNFFSGKREQEAEKGQGGRKGNKKGTAQMEETRQREKKCGRDDQDRSTWERCEVTFRRVVVDIESRLSRGQGQACQNCRNSGRPQLGC